MIIRISGDDQSRCRHFRKAGIAEEQEVFVGEGAEIGAARAVTGRGQEHARLDSWLGQVHDSSIVRIGNSPFNLAFRDGVLS